MRMPGFESRENVGTESAEPRAEQGRTSTEVGEGNRTARSMATRRTGACSSSTREESFIRSPPHISLPMK